MLEQPFRSQRKLGQNLAKTVLSTQTLGLLVCEGVDRRRLILPLPFFLFLITLKNLSSFSLTMGDYYKSLEDLKSDKTEDVDYKETLEDRNSKVTILSIHGGFIEYGTTEIAKEIAKDDLNYFDFNGLKKKSWKLHITSHRFDHEGLESLLDKSDAAVSIHGCVLKTLEEPAVCIGGLNERLKTLIKTHLEAAGFKVDLERFPANYSINVVNRSESSGVQLELTYELRESLFENLLEDHRKPKEDFYTFTKAVRSAIDKYLEL